MFQAQLRPARRKPESAVQRAVVDCYGGDDHGRGVGVDVQVVGVEAHQPAVAADPDRIVVGDECRCRRELLYADAARMVVGAQYAVRGIQFRDAGAGDHPEAAFAVFDRRADRVVVQPFVVGDDREPFGFGVEDIRPPSEVPIRMRLAAVGEDRRDAVSRDGIPVVGGVAGQFAGGPVAVEAAAAGSGPEPVVLKGRGPKSG